MPKKPSLEIKRDESRSKGYFFSIPATVSISGKRERRFFEKKAEAVSAREVELTRISNFGLSQATLPSEVRRDASRAEALLKPHGLTILEAVKQYVEAVEILDGTGCSLIDAARGHSAAEAAKANSCLFAALIEEFIRSKETEGVSSDYLKQIKRTKTAFEDTLGPINVCELNTKTLRESLKPFEDKQATYAAHLRVLKVALNFGIQHEYLKSNPADRIKPPKQAPREVKILKNEQARALLEAAHESKPEMLAFFAIGIFAGLRPTELRALEWQDVNLDRKAIFVRQRNANAKEQVGRSVPIEQNLAEWLKTARKREGTIAPSANFRTLFENVRQEADKLLASRKLGDLATLEKGWDQDCMRHTTASNWDAKTGNMAQTALWLGHTEKVHRKHYYHPVTKADATKFWSIRPKKAG